MILKLQVKINYSKTIQGLCMRFIHLLCRESETDHYSHVCKKKFVNLFKLLLH